MFNFLTQDYPQNLTYPCFYYYDREDVYQLCQGVKPSPMKVELISGYIKGDCTAVLIK